ncbi:MAG: oligosaccharide flippase family protein [Mucilaginibacter sp.]
MSKVLKNTAFYTIGNMVTTLSSFILIPVYTKYLSVPDYGVVSSMQTLSAILIVVITLALERSLYRIYYDYNTEAEKREFIGTIFIGLVCVGFICMGVCFLLKSYLNLLFPSIAFYPFFSYTIISTFILSIVNFSQTISQVKQNARRFITTSILLFVLTALFNLFFIIKLHYGALGMIIGTLLAAFVVLFVSLYNIIISVKFTFNKQKFKNAVEFSLPMLPSLLSTWILNLSDRVFISHYYTMTDVGIYSLAYRITSIVIFAASALFMAYNPQFYQVANDESRTVEERKAVIYKYNRIITVAVGVAGVLLLSISDLGIRLFFKPQFASAYYYMPVLIIAFVISQLCGLYHLMLYQNKKTWLVTYSVFLSAALNVGLNYFFIPVYGAYFAAISTIICNTVTFLLLYFNARKGFYVKSDWGTILIICGFYAAFVLENYYLRNYGVLLNFAIKLVTIGLLLLTFRKFILGMIALMKKKKTVAI